MPKMIAKVHPNLFYFCFCCIWFLCTPPMALGEQRYVDWRLLHQDGYFIRTGLSVLPLQSSEFVLQKGEVVTVLNKGGRLLKVDFIDARSDDDSSQLSEVQLDILVSENPGIAVRTVLSFTSPELSAAATDRVVEITNTQSDTIRFRVFEGLPIQFHTFAPISWKDVSQESDKYHSVITETNNHQHQYWTRSTPSISMPLEKGELYWLESEMHSSVSWDLSRSQNWLWYAEQINAADLLYKVTTWEATSRKRIAINLTPEKNKTEAPHFRPMLPALFQVQQSGEWHLQSVGDAHVRVQSVREDWFFDKNFEIYSQPGLLQLQKEQHVTQSISQRTDASGSEQSAIKNTVSVVHQAQRQAVNRALVNKTLQDDNDLLNEVYLVSERTRWAFDIAREPDLAETNKPISLNESSTAFLKVAPDEVISWQRPDDIVSNEVSLEIHWPGNQGELHLMVDEKPFQTLVSFQKYPDLTLVTDWRNSEEELRGNTSSVVKMVANQQLLLPDNWQSLQLKSHAGALVRMRYKANRKETLDGGQWQQLLAIESGDDRLQRFKIASGAWQEHIAFLQLKRTEFQAHNISEHWREMIESGVAISGLFDEKIPDSLPVYRTIQQLLLNPDTSSWEYWLTLSQSLKQSGWTSDSARVMQSVLLFHRDPQLRVAAANWLLDWYHQQQNHVLKTALLSYLHAEQLAIGEQSDSYSLKLASWFLQRNQPQRALFTLLGIRSSSQRSTLINEAAHRLGFLSLAKQFDAIENSTNDNDSETEKLTIIGNKFIKSVTATGNIQLRNVQQDLLQKNYLVTPGNPLKIDLSESAMLMIEARQWFDAANVHQKHDWLTVQFDEGERHAPIFYSDYRSPSLVHAEGTPGPSHRMLLTVPKSGVLEIKSQFNDIIVSIREAVSSNSIDSINHACQRDNTHSPGVTHFLNLWFEDEGKMSEYRCHLLRHKPADNAKFELFSHDGWALMPQGRRIIEALKTFESNGNTSGLAEMNKLIDAWPDSAEKVRLQQRLNQNARWQVLSNPISVKKFSVYRGNTNAPLSPTAFRSRLLVIPFKPDWEKITENTALNYELKAAQNEEFRILLEAQQHLFRQKPDDTAVVDVHINDDLFTSVTMSAGQANEVKFSLPLGNNRIRLQQRDNLARVNIIGKLQFRQDTNDWQQQPLQVGLRLFKADEQQPFETFVAEDSWLRIDSFDESGVVKHAYQFAPKGMFSWHPESDEYLGHRIYRLTKNTENNLYNGPAHSFLALPSSKSNPVQTFNIEPLTSNEESWREKGSGSWGAWLTKRQRRSPDEESVQNNRYLELGAYRQRHASDLKESIRYQVAARLYDGQFSDSYHGTVGWWNIDWLGHTDFNLEASFAVQDGIDNGSAWSAQIRAGLHWNYSINRRFFNRFAVHSWLNVIESGKDTGQYAASVYSQYKLDHRHGFRFTESMRYKWHHDLESWFNLQLNSNPIGQGDWLDNGTTELGTRLFYKGVALDVSWRYQVFNNDEDRTRSINDSRLGAGLEWFQWGRNKHLRWRLNYERNVLTDENYWNLGFSYNRSGFRGVRDYLPQSLAFSAIRQQEAALAITQSREQ